MTKILKIDRALYEVDDETKTYKYYGRNLEWQNLNPVKNEKNKKSIDGYTRIFPDGKQKIFHYQVNKKGCCCRIDRLRQGNENLHKKVHVQNVMAGENGFPLAIINFIFVAPVGENNVYFTGLIQ
jgi:hypothetical protein